MRFKIQFTTDTMIKMNQTNKERQTYRETKTDLDVRACEAAVIAVAEVPLLARPGMDDSHNYMRFSMQLNMMCYRESTKQTHKKENTTKKQTGKNGPGRKSMRGRSRRRSGSTASRETRRGCRA